MWKTKKLNYSYASRLYQSARNTRLHVEYGNGGRQASLEYFFKFIWGRSLDPIYTYISFSFLSKTLNRYYTYLVEGYWGVLQKAILNMGQIRGKVVAGGGTCSKSHLLIPGDLRRLLGVGLRGDDGGGFEGCY